MPQIAGGGLAARDHVVDHLINVDFELVDSLVSIYRLLRQIQVCTLKSVERRTNLRFHKPTHLQYARAHRLEFFVVFPHQMIAGLHF